MIHDYNRFRSELIADLVNCGLTYADKNTPISEFDFAFDLASKNKDIVGNWDNTIRIMAVPYSDGVRENMLGMLQTRDEKWDISVDYDNGFDIFFCETTIKTVN